MYLRVVTSPGRFPVLMLSMADCIQNCIRITSSLVSFACPNCRAGIIANKCNCKKNCEDSDNYQELDKGENLFVYLFI